MVTLFIGASGAALCFKLEGRWFDSVSLEFFMDIFILVALWSWGDSASSRNKYQEYLLGLNEAGA
jgi:hypothetical protein